MAKRIAIVLLSLLELVRGLAPPFELPPLLSKIDTHAHFVPPFYRDILESLHSTAGGLPIPEWDEATHLEFNSQFNIAKSVLSISTPGAKLVRDAPVEDGRMLARQLNEYGKNLTVQYPDNFLFFATLVLPDVEGSVAEAIYALDVLGAAGIIVSANTFGELLGTRRYDPLYKVLNDRHAVVFIHPGESVCNCGPKAAPTASALPPYLVDFLLDTTRAALELVYLNVTTDFPNIIFILAHSGGFLPFAAFRASTALAIFSGNLSASPIYLKELSEFNADVALSATRTALPSTLAFFNPTKITFGSDHPYAPVSMIQETVLGVESPPITPHGRVDVEKIASKNAEALFTKMILDHTPYGQGWDAVTSVNLVDPGRVVII